MSYTESDLCKYVVAHFRSICQDNPKIYTEVIAGDCRPDIVIELNGIITVIELKKNLSFEVLEQAYRHRHKCHFIYVAVPEKKKGIPFVAKEFLKNNGIGLLEIDMSQKYNRLRNDEDLCLFVNEKIQAKFQLRTKHKRKYIDEGIIKYLDDMFLIENNVNGGNGGGGYNSPYRMMIDEVKRFLRRKNGWCTIEEIIEKVGAVTTHYSSPNSSLYGALSKFEKDVESKIINKKAHFKLIN